MFGDRLKSIDWVSKINLTKTREEEVKECFNYTAIEFHYLDDLDDFDTLLETFKKNYKQVTDRKQMAIVTFLVKKKRLTDLLSWKTSWAWLTSQTILVTF